MRKLVLIAAMLMASASAHAGGFNLNIEGHKVQVKIPRGCSSLSCINVSAPTITDKFKDKEDTSSTTSTPATTATAPAAAPAPAPAPAAVQAAASPLGLWMSEKKEGKIRIEECDGNICGYSVDAKTGANGAKVLINMKPRGDKWTGRIKDTRSGSVYDSTIALRGNDKLKVQGCAFGGMFCGGETWTRIQ